ncbi:MAG TPA: hypothetical protein VNZ85_20340 [Caulobacter sp.]|nr:hypothetical protein [Caulobacter sp.]
MSKYFSWLFDAGEQRISTRIVELDAVVRRLEARFEAEAASRRDDLNRLSVLVEQTSQAARDQADALQTRLAVVDAVGQAASRWLEAQDSWLLDRANGRRFPVARTPDGQLLARLDRDERPPVAVISIPKAGTYLVGLLLERLGYHDTELHLSPTFLTDYRSLSIAGKRGAYQDHTFFLPLDASAMLVGGGQFVVGHLPYIPAAHRALTGFRKLFLHRNLVDATISHMRFFIETGRAGCSADWVGMTPSPDQLLAFLRDKGAELFEGSYQPLMGWLDDPEVFTISFDTLAGAGEDSNRIERLQALAAYLGCDQDLAQLLDREVIGQPTKTLSSGRTQAGVYLDERVREAFRALGVDALNARLGYGPV